MGDIFDTSFEGKKIELDDNKIELGEEVNLMEKDPTLTRIKVAAGWDSNAFDQDALDLDLCAFSLNKEGLTRVDQDFVFYNQLEGTDKAIIHEGDSRSGAGEGDDEVIVIDLRSISFEIQQVLFVVCVYKGIEKKQRLGDARNAYVRVVNAENVFELVRYEMDEDMEGHEETAVIAAALNREGPKWHFKPIGEFVEGGLPELVERYGLILGAV